MHRWVSYTVLSVGLAAFAALISSQEATTSAKNGAAQSQGQPSNANTTPEQRAADTREFLGLGPAPDKAAVARGAPLFLRNCAFCHGPAARGAEGPSLITSDLVLGDDHGEHLVLFLKNGRPEKGMPAFSTMSEAQLKDITEFVHQQVEDVANRGAYHVLNILVGNVEKGRVYVEANCKACHSTASFAHIASKYRSPDQLQRGWIWPSRPANGSLAVTATVQTANGDPILGRVTELSDFRITLVDHAGQQHVIDRRPGVDVKINDPLAAHQAMIMTLRNNDMHDVTAYLETLK